MSSFMISKTHGVAQKPCRKQLNVKYEVAEVPFFILSFFFVEQK